MKPSKSARSDAVSKELKNRQRDDGDENSPSAAETRADSAIVWGTDYLGHELVIVIGQGMAGPRIGWCPIEKEWCMNMEALP